MFTTFSGLSFIIMSAKKENTALKKYLERHEVNCPFHSLWPKDIPIIIVIPVYKEEGYLQNTLLSLKKCEAPGVPVGIVLVFNSSERDAEDLVEKQKILADKIRKIWKESDNHFLHLFVLEAYQLRRKHFGAGLARKIGMDSAAAFFFLNNKAQGIILTLDADTQVESNYLKAVLEWFENDNRKGASLYFEHPVEGEEFSSEIYQGIQYYELHLRYYLQALRYTGFPYAYHTMGSAIAVRAAAYAQIGGMPRKQAGEDFYFLQKLIPLGGFGDILNTKVFPSPRPSERVIFGTGAAIKNHIKGKGDIDLTYDMQAFENLKDFLDLKSELYTVKAKDYENWNKKLPPSLNSFLRKSGFYDEIEIIKKDCASIQSFDKRFYEVLNAFKIVKYLNFVHEHFYDKIPVFDAATSLLPKLNLPAKNFSSVKELLFFYRNLEKRNLIKFRIF